MTGESVKVTVDAEGLTSRSGAFRLREVADHLGLTEALLDAMAPTISRRSAHDPGRVTRDLAVSVADGSDCVSALVARRPERPLRRGRLRLHRPSGDRIDR